MTVLDPVAVAAAPAAVRELVERACAGIAPAWPLDRAIAVNPAHAATALPFERAAAEFAATHGVRLLPPRQLVREHWRDGRLRREHLCLAVRADGVPAAEESQAVEALVAAIATDPLPQRRLALLADFADAARRSDEVRPWSARVLEQISRHAAAWFDRGQANWAPQRQRGLYRSWRWRLGQDPWPPARQGRAGCRAVLRQLPADPHEAIGFVLAALALDAASPGCAEYLGALLGSVRGWASWCAHERWQARLRGGDDDAIVELLAIRLAWELLLLEDLALHAVLPRFRARLARHEGRVAATAVSQRNDRLLLRALESAYQEPLLQKFASPPPAAQPGAEAAVEVAAVFCIDVRSERMRRHLERSSRGAVATRGFAGFFGLPITFEPFAAAEQRPHLPGLFAPALAAGEVGPTPTATQRWRTRRQERLRWRQRWHAYRTGPGSAFGFVEACGLGALVDLVRDGFGSPRPERSEHSGLRDGERAQLRPCWHESAATDVQVRVDVAAGALRGMGLVRDFPRLVVFVGHGSSSRNNAHAAALDCGACGGHSGAANARLLAHTLADPAVRQGLAAQGVVVPEGTHFLAAVHDTTTDEVQCFADEPLLGEHADRVTRLERWLAAAGTATRAERAPGLDLGHLHARPAELLDTLRRRAGDWAQVRPEWGLADNAAVVFAPRRRTRHLDLEGRVFLHDYEAADDPDGKVLTVLLTAPMLVAHWINLQYYASVVDQRAFGSGSKLLHDVVGGRLGVFEGNGGDLRIGLPLQSVHDGARWRHTPQRLSVWVAAPAAAIDAVLAANEAPRRLVENGWLHLFRLAEDGTVARREAGGGWQPVVPQIGDPVQGDGATAVGRQRPPSGLWRLGALMAALACGILLRAAYGA